MFSWQIEPLQKVKIFCGIPVTPSFQYIHLLVQEAWEKAWKPPETIRVFERSHGVASAREKLAEKFLSTDASHFLLLDNDVVIMPDTIARLLQVNKPIVLGRYMEASQNRLPEAFHHSQRPWFRDAPIDFKKHEVFEFPKEDEDVILAGLGILLIKREVFEKLDKPYFLYSSEYGHLDDYFLISEDFFLCLRIQEYYRKTKDPSFKITYVPDIWVWHMGEAIVGGDGQVMFV